jgi:hypothetical protein
MQAKKWAGGKPAQQTMIRFDIVLGIPQLTH